MNNCKHLNTVGDNYGTSCTDCGEPLYGYGWGGYFGSRLTGQEVCIHLFAKAEDAEDAGEICIYCERWRKIRTED